MAHYFSPGESVVWRSVWRDEGVVGTAWPGTVVVDSDQLVALYRPVGTVGKQRSGERGGPGGRMLIKWDGGYRDLIWGGVNVLMLHRPGDTHSVWRAWDPDTWELAWRYLNLEEIWVRRSIGFDSKDLYLDMWCKPDGDWQWKDEAEAIWAAETGRISPAQLGAARLEADRALARIRRREQPHDRDWDAWRPDPSWPIPHLPPDWSRYDPRPV